MRKSLLTLNLSLFLALSFCAPQKKEIAMQPVPPPVLAAAQQHFAQGDFQKAIESYSIARQKYPDDEAVLVGYVQMLEEIKTTGDKAFEEKNYGVAEKHYSVLLENFPRFRHFQQSLSFDTKYLSLRTKEYLAASTEIQAREALQEGNYAKAMGAYRTALQTYPGEVFLKENLAQIAKEIHSQGEIALGGEEYADAGKAFSSLLKDYIWLNNSVPSLPFSKSSLEDAVKNCVTQLTKEGLILYRKGKLKEAIAVWKEILEFDPENTEIKKAVANAEEQLKKIKKLN